MISNLRSDHPELPYDSDGQPMNPEQNRPVGEWVKFLDAEEMPPAEIEAALANALGDGIFPSANDYIDSGISPESYMSWYRIGGFNIARMQELEEAFQDEIDWLGERTESPCGYSHTLSYQYCNGDISLEELRQIHES